MLERDIVALHLQRQLLSRICSTDWKGDEIPRGKETYPQVRHSSDQSELLKSSLCRCRDLAARNILVFSKDCVKVSDFGLSRALGVGKDYYQVTNHK